MRRKMWMTMMMRSRETNEPNHCHGSALDELNPDPLPLNPYRSLDHWGSVTWIWEERQFGEEVEKSFQRNLSPVHGSRYVFCSDFYIRIYPSPEQSSVAPSSLLLLLYVGICVFHFFSVTVEILQICSSIGERTHD